MEDDDGEDLDLRARVQTGSSRSVVNVVKATMSSPVIESSASKEEVLSSSAEPVSSLPLSTPASNASPDSKQKELVVSPDLPKGEFCTSSQKAHSKKSTCRFILRFCCAF